jgi:hypothetical protein
MSVMGFRMVVTAAVLDLGVETVFIDIIIDGSDVATWLLQAVLSHNFVTVAGLLLSMRISSRVISHTIREIVFWVGLGTIKWYVKQLI